eukprot:Seg3840.3 transcript_id=Seg3840.3/GoldUCD/mRNA.D3Y31 product=Synaptotagmin-1 protein_id=Seg3840.3/GoldUCD/D3Y31
MMGRIKKTIVIILVILVILTIAVVVYIVRRIRRTRDKKTKHMEEEEEEEIVDEEVIEMQKELVEKTPLAVYSNQDFDSDKEEITSTSKMVIAPALNYDQSTLWQKYQKLKTEEEEKYCDLSYGRIKVEFYHQSYVQTFKMRIVNARGLKCNDPRRELNSRVKVLLITPLKTRHIPRRTNVVENSNDPDYDQVLEIKLTRKTTRDSTVEVSMWSIDEFYKESLMGGFRINLKSYDVAQRTIIEEEIQVDFEEHENPGHIMVSLGYNREEEKLIVIVMRGKMLKCSAHEDTLLQETINPYTKVYLYNNRKRIKKEKTETKRDQINPVYNQVMEFLVPQSTIESTNVVFVVMHKDVRTDSKENIGRIIIGANSSGRCWEHWKKALSADGKLIAQWHQLWH